MYEMWEKDQKVEFNLYKYKCRKYQIKNMWHYPLPPPHTQLTPEEHLGEKRAISKQFITCIITYI